VQHLYQVQANELEYQGMLLDLETRQNVEGIYEVRTFGLIVRWVCS